MPISGQDDECPGDAAVLLPFSDRDQKALFAKIIELARAVVAADRRATPAEALKDKLLAQEHDLPVRDECHFRRRSRSANSIDSVSPCATGGFSAEPACRSAFSRSIAP